MVQSVDPCVGLVSDNSEVYLYFKYKQRKQQQTCYCFVSTLLFDGANLVEVVCLSFSSVHAQLTSGRAAAVLLRVPHDAARN